MSAEGHPDRGGRRRSNSFASPPDPVQAGSTVCGQPDDSGLMTLEWLLIVAAIAALAATSVLVVQRVLDTTTDRADDREVLLIEADIEAARITSDFAAAGSSDVIPFRAKCAQLAARLDLIALITWEAASSEILDDPGTDVNEWQPAMPARCSVSPR